MSSRIFLRLAGAGSLGLGGLYYSVRREHERDSLPRGTNYRYPPALRSRSSMLSSLKNDEFDVLVIGGGCTGAAVALDCATRGLKCALVEADDFASGTSSKSTKLLHGGIRYLESAILHLDFNELRFVWKALEERAHLLQAAPFSNSPLPIVMPLYKMWQIPYFWFNIKVYELLARFFCCNETGVPSSYYVGKSNAIDSFPPLRHDGLLGAVVYYDGQHNDSRTNLLMAITSTIDDFVPGQVGSTICNHLRVVDLLKDENGKVCGATVLDTLNNETFDIKAKTLVNCGGPFAEEVRRLTDVKGQANVLHSRGTHIVLPEKYTPTQFGMVIPKTTDGRVLFILPWQGRALIGTTDTKDDLAWNPLPRKEDLDFICKDASIYMNCDANELKRDIASAWSGLRPLLKDFGDTNSTEKLSRGHVIKVDESTGLVNVFGGKWTICRLMAQECVDALIKAHGDVLKPTSGCRTRNMQLYGTHDPQGQCKLEEIQPKYNSLSQQIRNACPAINFRQANLLVEAYGYKAKDILDMCIADPNLAKPIHPEFPYIMAQVHHAIDKEYACTLVDVLVRRTRIAFLDAKAALSVVEPVAEVMAQKLKWDSNTRQQRVKEVVDYINTMTTEAI